MYLFCLTWTIYPSYTLQDQVYIAQKQYKTEQNRTEQNRNFITLKLLQFLVTLHTYTTIYNFGD